MYSQTSLGYAAGVFVALSHEEEQIRQIIVSDPSPLCPFLHAHFVEYPISGNSDGIIALRAKSQTEGVQIRERPAPILTIGHESQQKNLPAGHLRKTSHE